MDQVSIDSAEIPPLRTEGNQRCRPDGKMERRQRRAAPYLRHERGVRYNWPTAGVCAAFHPRIDFTPSLCPSLTTPLCNNNHQPTNQPYSILSYTILSYPILSCPSLRRATKLLALSNLSPCFSISLERTARVHIRSSHSRTPFAHEAHERAGTKNERGTSEREAREGVGGEGGGAHKGR